MRTSEFSLCSSHTAKASNKNVLRVKRLTVALKTDKPAHTEAEKMGSFVALKVPCGAFIGFCICNII